jgi:hypothetical protein
VILDLGAGRDADKVRPSLSQPASQIAPSRTSTGNVFSGRAPVVAFTAPASGLNAP